MGIVLNMGLLGVWIAQGLDECLRAAGMGIRWKKKGYTNIDYFPTNFVVQNEELYYIDFECNDYMDEWNFENWGIKYWSKTDEFRQYVKTH